MRIAIGADHGGYPLNERVIEELRSAGHEIIDFGTHDGSVPTIILTTHSRWARQFKRAQPKLAF